MTAHSVLWGTQKKTFSEATVGLLMNSQHPLIRCFISYCDYIVKRDQRGSLNVFCPSLLMGNFCSAITRIIQKEIVWKPTNNFSKRCRDRTAKGLRMRIQQSRGVIITTQWNRTFHLTWNTVRVMLVNRAKGKNKTRHLNHGVMDDKPFVSVTILSSPLSLLAFIRMKKTAGVMLKKTYFQH